MFDNTGLLVLVSGSRVVDFKFMNLSKVLVCIFHLFNGVWNASLGDNANIHDVANTSLMVVFLLRFFTAVSQNKSERKCFNVPIIPSKSLFGSLKYALHAQITIGFVPESILEVLLFLSQAARASGQMLKY